MFWRGAQVRVVAEVEHPPEPLLRVMGEEGEVTTHSLFPTQKNLWK
jgi:hypothetical protein